MQPRTPQQPGWMVELTAAVDIPVEKIQWIWPGWLPRAKLSILAGAGGCGKTTLAISLAARLSRGGDWPDGSKCEAAGNVIIWSGEDGIADTIIPRLTAADADLTRVHIIEGLRDQRGNRRQFDPAANFALLNEAAARIDGVSLLIFGKRPARPPFARTPRPASCAFSSRGFIWKRCTRGARPGLSTSRPGGTAG